jgi:tetratricopeptide (TPR) repeat protein
MIGVSIDQLQASFDKTLDARFGALRAALRPLPGAAPAGEDSGPARPENTLDLAALRAAAASHPGSYAVQLAYGRALAAAGDKAAFEPLEKAAALVPITSGEDTPHAIMAALAEKLGDPVRAMAEYKAVLAQDHTTVDAARQLAALAEKASSTELLTMAYERVVAIDPFDPLAHSGLGRLAVKGNQSETAVREFKAALALGPADRAAAHCDLAEALLLARKPAEAKTEALAALEIAPTYDRAQDLLLRAIQGAGPSGAQP